MHCDLQRCVAIYYLYFTFADNPPPDQDGANVVVNYVANPQAAGEVVNAINSLGKGKAVAVQADVSSITGANSLLEETIKAFGQLDILVLNAGIMGSKVLADVDEQFFDSHIAINVKGPLFLTKAAAPLLPPGTFPTSFLAQLHY